MNIARLRSRKQVITHTVFYPKGGSTMRKYIVMIVLGIVTALGFCSTQAFAGDAPAIVIEKVPGSLGCKNWQNQAAFSIDNNTKLPWTMTFDAQGGYIDEQGYDNSKWYSGKGAYAKIVETVESTVDRGKSVTVKVRVVLNKTKVYTKTLYFTRTSKKC